MENTESIYKEAANQFYFSFDKQIQRLLDQTSFKLNTTYSIFEIWTDSSKVAEKLGKKKNVLNHAMWKVFPQHWQLRIVLDRCYDNKKDVMLWSSGDLDYLVAGHKDREPVFIRKKAEKP